MLGENEYREFLAYYPTHRRAGYAQSKLGMTFFGQMHSADRDQTETRKAIKELAAFVERYPDDPLIEEGKREAPRGPRPPERVPSTKVGYHYYRSRWYPGAMDRFKVLLDQDPQYTRRDAVYFYLGECFVKGGRPAEGLPFYDRLIKEFEQSEYLEQARKRMTEIKAEMDAKVTK